MFDSDLIFEDIELLTEANVLPDHINIVNKRKSIDEDRTFCRLDHTCEHVDR